MNILFIGDVVGKPGRNICKFCLERYIDEYHIDFVIANLENASHGKGLIREHFLEMLESGVDVATLGNHFLAKKEINSFIDDYDNLLRPANYHHSLPGHGSDVYDVGPYKIRVTNLIGRVYMNTQVDNPFDVLQDIVSIDHSDYHIVDFHAEATGEKMALAWAFDGKITALIGTHTHVQTNDLRKLSKGTVYISDIGMCGPYNGILGSSRDEVIAKTWTGKPTIFNVQQDDQFIFNGLIISIDDDTKKVIDCKIINDIINEREISNG